MPDQGWAINLARGRFQKVAFSGGPYGLMKIEISVPVSLSTNIHCDKFEEISDLKVFPECFRGPLKTLWQATCGGRAASYPLLC